MLVWSLYHELSPVLVLVRQTVSSALPTIHMDASWVRYRFMVRFGAHLHSVAIKPNVATIMTPAQNWTATGIVL